MRGRKRAVLVLISAVLVVVGSVLTPGAASATIDDSAPLSSWRPDNGHTYAMVRAGDTMIIGGDFSWMKAPDGSVARRYGLAAISLTTGDLLPWAPAVSGTVGSRSSLRTAQRSTWAGRSRGSPE